MTTLFETEQMRMERLANEAKGQAQEQEQATVSGGSTGTGKTNKPSEANGNTCYYVITPNKPEEGKYITLVALCDEAQKWGMSRGYAVALTGGDGGKKMPKNEVYTVYVWGNRKFVAKEAVVRMQTALKTAGHTRK